MVMFGKARERTVVRDFGIEVDGQPRHWLLASNTRGSKRAIDRQHQRHEQHEPYFEPSHHEIKYSSGCEVNRTGAPRPSHVSTLQQ